MTKNVVIGVNPEGLSVDVLAAFKPGELRSNLDAIQGRGYIALVTTEQKAREIWGQSFSSLGVLIHTAANHQTTNQHPLLFGKAATAEYTRAAAECADLHQDHGLEVA